MASTLPSPDRDDPYADRRIHPRVSVALPAFLDAEGQRLAVHLLDLSAGGAKLNCPSTIEAGSAVVLHCGTIAQSAIVRWQNGEQVGICFNSLLDARQVSALTDRSQSLADRMNTRG